MNNGILTQKKLDELLLGQLTDEQKNAVVARGGTILLSASAGSGKTSVLTSRIIKLITDREIPVDADRLLILTFSNAAAGEMKQRILQKINELLHLYPKDSILQRQHMLLNKAQISTIHSFCIDILREHFDKAGLSPDFRVVEDSVLEEQKDKVMEELLEEYYQKNDPVFLRLVQNFYSKSNQDRNLMEAVRQIYTYIRSNPFPLSWLNKCLQSYKEDVSNSKEQWEKIVLGHVRQMVKHCLELLDAMEQAVRPDGHYRQRYQAFLLSGREKLSAFDAVLEQGDWNQAYAFAQELPLEKVTHIRRNAKAYRADLSNSIGIMCSQIDEIVKSIGTDYINLTEQDFYDDVRQQAEEIEKLFELVESFYHRIRQAKQEANVVDFGDVEEYAVTLLAEEAGDSYRKTHICKSYCHSFEEILIDEFQDTNRAQDLIFRCISREENNIFMVGDVKQSIYRFRKAMPEIFIENLKRFHPYDGVQYPANIVMAKNFRSRKEVTNSINYLFHQIMSGEVGEITYDKKQELVAHNDFLPAEDLETEIQIVDIPEKVKKEEAVILEARHIACQIQKMVENKVLVQGEDKQPRPCTYGDFCILLRSAKSKIPFYLKELQQLGIEAWTKETGGYFSSREVSLIIHFLKAIDNPTLDVSLLAVLLSPLFDFTPDDMANIQIYAEETAESLYQKIKCACAIEGSLGKRCRDFLALFEQLRMDRASMPAEEFIQEVYNHTFFLEIAGAMDFGKQKQANLRLLLQYAKDFNHTETRYLSDFLRYVDKVVENHADVRIANIQLQNADAVKIMTIHNSKGLEFPICFLADCANPFNRVDLQKTVLMGNNYGFAMKRVEAEYHKKYNTLAYTALSITNEKQMLSEEMRILYVALTRAKERLILTANVVGNGGESALPSLLQTLQAGLGETERIMPYKVYRARSYLDWILMGFIRHPDLKSLEDEEMDASTIKLSRGFSEHSQCSVKVKRFAPIPKPEQEQEERKKITFTAPCDPEEYTRFQEKMEYTYPYRALEDIPAKLSVTQIAKTDDFEFNGLTKRPEFMLEHSLTKAEIGTLNHEFLQFADFKHAVDSVQKEIRRLVQNGFIAGYKADKLDIQKLEAFFRSDIARRMLHADALYREFAFMHEMPVNDLYQTGQDCQETILIQGIADCVFIENGHVVIVDYKTDKVSRETVLAERYRNQLLLYKTAVERAFNLPVKELVIYSFHLSREINIGE